MISKEAGFGLADIRTMLAARSAPARREVMARHRERLPARIARAQAALDMLQGECPYDDIMTYPHFQGFLADRLQRALSRDGVRIVITPIGQSSSPTGMLKVLRANPT